MIESQILQGLPQRLQNELAAIRKDWSHTADTVNRFWIEAGKVPYTCSEEGNEEAYTFGDCTLKVLKHLMLRDHEGNLVDTCVIYPLHSKILDWLLHLLK